MNMRTYSQTHTYTQLAFEVTFSPAALMSAPLFAGMIEQQGYSLAYKEVMKQSDLGNGQRSCNYVNLYGAIHVRLLDFTHSLVYRYVHSDSNLLIA